MAVAGIVVEDIAVEGEDIPDAVTMEEVGDVVGAVLRRVQLIRLISWTSRLLYFMNVLDSEYHGCARSASGA